MNEPILKFETEGLILLNFFTKGLLFPVAIAAYSEWEEQQVTYLTNNFQEKKMTTEDLCKWCMEHGLKYQIMYPLERMPMLRNPLKYYKYLQLKKITDKK